jgi:hypothetical protein
MGNQSIQYEQTSKTSECVYAFSFLIDTLDIIIIVRLSKEKSYTAYKNATKYKDEIFSVSVDSLSSPKIERE